MIEEEIWIIDDDRDDHELVQGIMQDLGFKNKIRTFDGARVFLEHLSTSPSAPFLILCDVNIPGMSGFQLREKMLEEGNKKFHSVPFIFWSNAASEQQIAQAYRLRAHGFFIKEASYKEWKLSFEAIIKYWRTSKMPAKADMPDAPLK